MNFEFIFNIPTTFNKDYTCYPMTFYKNSTKMMENGGKILLPSSALEYLTRLHIQYPMLFKLTDKSNERHTHCGVLEFSAEEGTIYAPYWMMLNLNIKEGETVKVENVALKVATYAKFQPLTQDFHNITNPKAVLENALRDFACLTTGDLLAINYNNKAYELKVLETKPSEAVSIIECDMQVEFAEPMITRVEEPCFSGAKISNSEEEDAYVSSIESTQNSKSFRGKGVRLDGKVKDVDTTIVRCDKEVQARGIPNYDYKPGLLNFCRSKPITNQGDIQTNDFVSFSGEGRSLRNRK